MHIRELLRDLQSLPKTIYFNYKTLPIKEAIKLPIYVDYDIKFGKLYKGVIKLPKDIQTYQIKLGKRSLDDVPEMTKGYITMTQNSNIIFKGTAELAYGITLCALSDSTIIIGNDFYCNKNCSIVSSSEIKIGNNVLFGWNVSVRDSDGGQHKIFVNGLKKENKISINISDHSWLCSYSSILKGVTISKNVVIGYGAIVSKSINFSNVIVAGNPAKIVCKNIEWKR